MGRGHVCRDDPGRRRGRGDLPGGLRLARDTPPVGAALSLVHTLRGDPDAGPDGDARAHQERSADADGHPDAGSDPDGVAHPVQPRVAGLPDAAAPADNGRDANPQGDPDRGRRDPDAYTDGHADAGSHHPTELDAAADRARGLDADAFPLSRPGQRAKSSRLPLTGVIDERCSSMSTDGGWPVSITTAMRSERRSPPMRTQSRRNVNAIGRTRFQI